MNANKDSSAALLRFWFDRPHRLRNARLILFKVLIKAAREILRLAIVSVFVFPGIARLQHLLRYFRTRNRNAYTKNRIGRGLSLRQFAAEDRANHGPRVTDLHSFPDAVWSTTPACINQPARSVVLAHLLAQQIRVNAGMQHHERGAKASGKS